MIPSTCSNPGNESHLFMIGLDGLGVHGMKMPCSKHCSCLFKTFGSNEPHCTKSLGSCNLSCMLVEVDMPNMPRCIRPALLTNFVWIPYTREHCKLSSKILDIYIYITIHLAVVELYLGPFQLETLTELAVERLGMLEALPLVMDSFASWHHLTQKLRHENDTRMVKNHEFPACASFGVHLQQASPKLPSSMSRLFR